MSGETHKHVVVINRWQEHYAQFERYTDHTACRVSYVTTRVGLASVPAAAHDVALVDSTGDLGEVRARVRALARRHGAPDGIVALKEDDLLIGTALREEWGCPGPRTEDLLPFRDKYLMCRAIRAAGLPVPAFAAVSEPAEVLDFAAAHGWPVIVKPRLGSASAGVVRVDGPEQAADLVLDREPMLAQAFDDGRIYHVDGVFDGSALTAWRASRYLNTCLDFRVGTFLGSVEEDDPELNRAVGPAAERFLGALTARPTVFHLELFVRHTPGSAPDCTFLEAGARVGGAEIPFLWREVHGYDLMQVAWEYQLAEPLRAEPPDGARRPGPGTAASSAVAGWMLVPAPEERPCRITKAVSMLGRNPGPYAEVVLSPGEVLPAADAYYEHVGGRFRFRGESTAEVEAAIVATARDFRVSAEPAERSAVAAALPA
jgi:hypothetical protein